jgi:hypothetical protein
MEFQAMGILARLHSQLAFQTLQEAVVLRHKK